MIIQNSITLNCSKSGFYIYVNPVTRFVRGYRRKYDVMTTFGLSGCLYTKCVYPELTCINCPFET